MKILFLALFLCVTGAFARPCVRFMPVAVYPSDPWMSVQCWVVPAYEYEWRPYCRPVLNWRREDRCRPRARRVWSPRWR